MPRSLKLLLGAVTAVPLVLVGYLLARFLSVAIAVYDSGGSVYPARMWDTFYGLLTVQVVTLAILVVLLGVYLWHFLVHQARREANGQGALWVLALVFVPILAMPVYWLIHIWPEGEARQGRTGAPEVV